MWSKKFAVCVQCGKTDSKHKARGVCSRCYMEDYNRRYNEAHREELRAGAREYHWAHREKRVAYMREWHEGNKEHEQKYSRAYRAEHREHCLALYRARYQRHIVTEREQALARYHADPEPRRAYHRLYMRRNGKRLGRKAKDYGRGSALYRWNRHRLIVVLDLPCELCGSRERREIHHRVRLIDGGSDHLRNLHVLCYICHRGPGVGVHSPKRRG